MSSLEVVVGPSGRAEVLARYVEFVAARCRPNTVLATESDLRSFFVGSALSINGLEQIVASAKVRAGLERATCHQLRHTCLTRLREAGMALEAIQAQAGHRSIESTRVYLHLADGWLASEYQRASDLIDTSLGILR